MQYRERPPGLVGSTPPYLYESLIFIKLQCLRILLIDIHQHCTLFYGFSDKKCANTLTHKVGINKQHFNLIARQTYKTSNRTVYLSTRQHHIWEIFRDKFIPYFHYITFGQETMSRSY